MTVKCAWVAVAGTRSGNAYQHWCDRYVCIVSESDGAHYIKLKMRNQRDWVLYSDFMIGIEFQAVRLAKCWKYGKSVLRILFSLAACALIMEKWKKCQIITHTAQQKIRTKPKDILLDVNVFDFRRIASTAHLCINFQIYRKNDKLLVGWSQSSQHYFYFALHCIKHGFKIRLFWRVSLHRPF